MALPSSGQISFYDCFVEFNVVGTCLQAESSANIYMSDLRLAQVPSYSYGTIVYMSGFYGSACPKGGGK
jgi:hypothetical protein